MLAAIVFERFLPRRADRTAACADTVAKPFIHPFRKQELRVLWPMVGVFSEAHLLFAKGVTVGRGRVLFVRSAITNNALDDHEGRAILGAPKGLQREIGRASCREGV